MPCSKNGSKTNLANQVFGSVACTNNDFRKIAELTVTQDDLAAWIGSKIIIWITAISQLRNLTLGCITIEDSSFAALGLVEGYPFIHEGSDFGTLLIDGRVVRKCALRVNHPPLTDLCITHTLIVEIGQTDESRTANTADNDNLSDLADDIVAFDGCQLATLCLEEGVGCELEEVNKRLGTRCATTECLQPCALWTHLGDIPLGQLSRNQQADEFLVCLCPPDLRILNNDHGVAREELFRNCRQLLNEMVLNAEAYACSAHEYIQNLVKRTNAIDCNEGAIVTRDMIALKCGTCGHQCPHGRHHLKIEYRCLQFLALLLRDLVAKMLVEEVKITSNGLLPCFSAILVLKPSAVAGQMDEVLIGSWKTVTHVFLLCW